MIFNLGLADRVVRFILGFVILALYFTQVIDGTSGIVLVLVAVVSLMTCFLGFCPFYNLMGINTKNDRQEG